MKNRNPISVSIYIFICNSYFGGQGTLVKVKFTSKKSGSPEKIEKTIIGKPFPEITSKSLAGRLVTLPEDARGKVALIALLLCTMHRVCLIPGSSLLKRNSKRIADLQSTKFL